MDNLEGAMWHRCLGYNVLVSPDGYVLKHFSQKDPRPRIKVVKEKLTLGAFKARVWNASKRGASVR